MANQKVRFCFITSTPMTVQEGSGTFAGITTLAKALTNLGHSVEFAAPRHRIPIYTLQRFLFNQSLRLRTRGEFDAIVGFDLDGYTVALGRGRHVASIKGVIADEMRFESGATRLTMALQARWEKFHVQRADSVITTSRYAAERIQQLYGLREAPAVVPEAIDLKAWQAELASADGKIDPRKFVVLTVCRFYPRKRLDVLLGATEKLRSKIPGLEVRIIGGGPEFGKLKRIWQEKDLEDIVKWKLNLPQQELLNEYKSCDVFCLPSVQEGFGIVFLEAMASGKPIVAARAAAVPEVVRHGVLVEPDSEDALADGIYRLYENPAPRVSLASAGKEFVKQFDSRFVAEQFLSCLGFASASPPVSYAINL
jgi:glycosyltransferase involved in cell wall biosynthesis